MNYYLQSSIGWKTSVPNINYFRFTSGLGHLLPVFPEVTSGSQSLFPVFPEVTSGLDSLLPVLKAVRLNLTFAYI